VNTLVDKFRDLIQHRNAEIVVLCGNHDRALHAQKPYWSFLSALDGLTFIREPTARGDLLLLPFSEKPYEDWADIPFDLYKAVFCHQTFRGANRGDRIDTGNLAMDIFPPHLKVYSGDLHIPQELGRLTYIGAPYPIKYGDDYPCRLLRLDHNYDVIERIPLFSPRKRIINISSADELLNTELLSGDSARIRLTLPIEKIDTWQAEQDKIATWAKERGITVSSIEPTIETGPRHTDMEAEMTDVFSILSSFAEAEGLDEDLLFYGLDLLQQAKGT
jgi:DNA repair exonuclease SbcCD nuclease subunit